MHAQDTMAKEAIVAAILLAAAVVNLIPAHVAGGLVGDLRRILSVPLLVLPGWSLCLVIFGQGTLTLAERVAVSGCLTLAVLVIVGLALNALPGGLDQTSWTWSLIVVTLGAVIVATVTRKLGTAAAGGWALPPLGVSVGVVLAVALMFVGFAFARHSASVHANAEKFTEFWTLPGSAHRSVRYGITNHEGRKERYTLIVRASASHRTLFHSLRFSLAAGNSRMGTVSVPAGAPRDVLFELYRSGEAQGTPYRSTRLELS